MCTRISNYQTLNLNYSQLEPLQDNWAELQELNAEIFDWLMKSMLKSCNFTYRSDHGNS